MAGGGQGFEPAERRAILGGRKARDGLESLVAQDARRGGPLKITRSEGSRRPGERPGHFEIPLWQFGVWSTVPTASSHKHIYL